MSDRGGFTLPEVIATLALLSGMGLCLLLAVGQLRTEGALELAAATLAADLRETETRAWAEGVVYDIVFAADGYSISGGGAVRIVELGAKIANPMQELRFLPTGFPAMGASIKLETGGRSCRVIVAAVTGRVRVAKEDEL
jgi:prepilin-type N-terminal cleavage/methylation domain-containing protein